MDGAMALEHTLPFKDFPRLPLLLISFGFFKCLKLYYKYASLKLQSLHTSTGVTSYNNVSFKNITVKSFEISLFNLSM